MLVQLRSQFEKLSNKQITQNNNDGFEFYNAQKPVKSLKDETVDSLDDARRNEAFLRKKNKELQEKIKDLEDKLDGGNDAGPNSMDQDVNFKKHCDNDKVIKSINLLMNENDEELKKDTQESNKLT